MGNTTLSGNIIVASIVDVAWTPAIVATVSSPAQSLTVPGVKIGDSVRVHPPSYVDGVAITGAIVTAANTVSVKFVNPTAGGVTPAAGTYSVTVFRREGLAGAPRVTT